MGEVIVLGNWVMEVGWVDVMGRNGSLMCTYIGSTRNRRSLSFSSFRSSKKGILNLCFRSVFPHPGMGHGAGPCEKFRFTQPSHIL